MRETKNSSPEEKVTGRERARKLFANNSTRLAALRLVIVLAFVSGIALSFNLWFPASRSFPRAPLIIALPPTIVRPVEWILSSFLIAALVAVAVSKSPLKYLLSVIVLLTLLILFDQMRLQPWVYQYFLLFSVIALHEWQNSDERSTRLTLSLLQLIVAMFYFWGGVQKLNYSFSHEVLTQLLTPLQNHFPLTEIQIYVLGISLAFAEIFIGCGLLLKRTRKLCVWLALAMHAVVLLLLIGEGRNSVVWVWNAALMLAVVVLFWRSDVFVSQTWGNREASSTFVRVARILAVVWVLLPILSFWGWWDLYLSGALYSGNTSVGVIRVDKRAYESLPETARRQVFTTKLGEQMLPLFEWSMTELNVPPYPELRVFKQITREVCKSAEDKSQVELIVKESPATLDGSYRVVRMNCLQLGR